MAVGGMDAPGHKDKRLRGKKEGEGANFFGPLCFWLTEHAHIDRSFFDAVSVGRPTEVTSLIGGAHVTNHVTVGPFSQSHFDVNHLRHLLLLPVTSSAIFCQSINQSINQRPAFFIIYGCLVITGYNAYCFVKLYVCHACFFPPVLLLYCIYYVRLPFCGEKKLFISVKRRH